MPHGGFTEDRAHPVLILGTVTPLHPVSISGKQLVPKERDPHVMWGWVPLIPSLWRGRGSWASPGSVGRDAPPERGPELDSLLRDASLYRLYPGNPSLD